MTEYPFCCGCPFGASCGTASGLKTDYFKADFSADLKSGSAPLTVQFEDWSFGEPDSWSWDFGDGGSSTQQNPIHTYRNPGTYTVFLTVSREYRSGFTSVTESRTIAKNAFITVTGISSVVSPLSSQGTNPGNIVKARLGDRIQGRESDIRSLVGSPMALSSLNFPNMAASEATRVNVIMPIEGNTIAYPAISIEERTAGITEVLSQSRMTLTQGSISETGRRSFFR
jgi:hypothetical protein